MTQHPMALASPDAEVPGGDEPLLAELLRDHGDRWQIARTITPHGWIAVEHCVPAARQVLTALTLTSLSEELSRHLADRESSAGDRLPSGFVQDVLNDSRLTDMLMDALEARIVALEEIAAARCPRRLIAAWRLGRSLRASIRHFSGSSFAERRYEAASTEWGSA